VDAAIAASARDALVGAITVGALPFPGFGTPATQALAVAQIRNRSIAIATTTTMTGVGEPVESPTTTPKSHPSPS